MEFGYPGTLSTIDLISGTKNVILSNVYYASGLLIDSTASNAWVSEIQGGYYIVSKVTNNIIPCVLAKWCCLFGPKSSREHHSTKTPGKLKIIQKNIDIPLDRFAIKSQDNLQLSLQLHIQPRMGRRLAVYHPRH